MAVFQANVIWSRPQQPNLSVKTRSTATAKLFSKCMAYSMHMPSNACLTYCRQTALLSLPCLGLGPMTKHSANENKMWHSILSSHWLTVKTALQRSSYCHHFNDDKMILWFQKLIPGLNEVSQSICCITCVQSGGLSLLGCNFESGTQLNSFLIYSNSPN